MTPVLEQVALANGRLPYNLRVVVSQKDLDVGGLYFVVEARQEGVGAASSGVLCGSLFGGFVFLILGFLPGLLAGAVVGVLFFLASRAGWSELRNTRADSPEEAVLKYERQRDGMRLVEEARRLRS